MKTVNKFFKYLQIPLLLMLIVVAIQGFMSKPLLNRLGINLFVVSSGSMEPNVPLGSLVYVQEVSPQVLHEGEIILYQKGRGLVLHRINKIHDDSIITKGDANRVEDPEKVRFSHVVGRYQWHLPYIGYLNLFVRTKIGLLLLVILPILYLLYSELRDNMKKINIKSKDSKLAIILLCFFLSVSQTDAFSSKIKSSMDINVEVADADVSSEQLEDSKTESVDSQMDLSSSASVSIEDGQLNIPTTSITVESQSLDIGKQKNDQKSQSLDTSMSLDSVSVDEKTQSVETLSVEEDDSTQSLDSEQVDSDETTQSLDQQDSSESIETQPVADESQSIDEAPQDGQDEDQTDDTGEESTVSVEEEEKKVDTKESKTLDQEQSDSKPKPTLPDIPDSDSTETAMTRSVDKYQPSIEEEDK